MLCSMSLKPKSPNPVSSTGCIAIMSIVLLLSNACKGQDGSPDPVTPRVLGGEDAPEGRFPYMCSIREPESGNHACGGTVIGKQWVMTAAHCLDPDVQNSAGLSPFFRCNIDEREDDDDSKRFNTIQCFLHHAWNGDVTCGNDIALYLYPQTVYIPRLVDFGHESNSADLFDVLGWGRTGPDPDPADVLQIGSGLELIPRSTCNGTSNLSGRIKDSMICAGGRSRDTCRGDSGGPLLIRHDPANTSSLPDPQLDLIVGITSFGVTRCIAELPGVYTRVSCYRPWITCIMEGTEQDCSVHSPCGVEPSLCCGVQKSATFDESDALRRMTRAIASDESETVKQLLCDGLSPAAVYDRSNNSLLHRAAQYDAIESAKVLLEHGAEIEYKNNDGQAALSRAASSGSPALARLLIENGADIETKDNSGRTPLILTARYNRLEVAQILIENGVDTENAENQGWTPLHAAAYANSFDVAKVLIANGAAIESKQRSGLTPLHITARHDSTEVAEVLIQNEAVIEAETNGGASPLMVAAYHGSLNIVKLLLNEGAGVDFVDNNGRSALYWAAARGHISIVSSLLSSGASKTKTNDDGKTPFDAICTSETSDEVCNDENITTLQELLRA